MSVADAVRRELDELAKRDKDLARGAVANMALVLAARIDDPSNSATSVSLCAGKLLDALETLRVLAPVAADVSPLDEIRIRRDRRTKAVS